MTATATAAFGNTRISYRVERGKRRLTVAVIVDPTDGVILRVPMDLAADRIDRVVRNKAPWIVRRMREFEDLLPVAAEREFVSGEGFHYLGRQHRLKVELAEPLHPPTVALRNGRLAVTVHRGLGEDGRAALVRTALVRWYRERAAAYLPRRVTHWAEKLSIAAPKLLIREPRNRWGSCDADGMVRINWRVMQVAPRLVDYVIAHELVHLEHRKHDWEFWRRLGEVMGDAASRRAALRRSGARTVW